LIKIINFIEQPCVFIEFTIEKASGVVTFPPPLTTNLPVYSELPSENLPTYNKVSLNLKFKMEEFYPNLLSNSLEVTL